MDFIIESIRRNDMQKVAAICYIFKNGKFLMIDRKKEPFSGYLVAPGGKKEDRETILDCVKREIHEETGLSIHNPQLKVITTEVGPDYYNWILFIYICSDFDGDVIESSEGKLVWIEENDIKKERLSKIDKEIYPYIFEKNIKIMHLSYDSDKNCTIEKIDELIL